MANETGYCVAANALLSGRSVYLRKNGTWSQDIVEAQVFAENKEAESVGAIAAADESHAIGVYVIAVTWEDKSDHISIVPNHYREKLRLSGPTVDWAPRAMASQLISDTLPSVKTPTR